MKLLKQIYYNHYEERYLENAEEDNYSVGYDGEDPLNEDELDDQAWDNFQEDCRTGEIEIDGLVDNETFKSYEPNMYQRFCDYGFEKDDQEFKEAINKKI